MLKSKIDLLRNNSYLFRKIESVDLKKIGVKKKVDILKCTDEKDFFNFIIFVSGKSRFLQKNSDEIEEIYQKTVEFCGHNFKYKKIFMSQSLCKKAKVRLQENEWEVNSYDFV